MPISDLTQRDFDAHVASLIARARETSPGLWNSWFEGDLGKVLLDLIAWDNNVLGLIADQQVREVSPDTLRLRESILHHVRLHGYYVRRSTPAALRVQVLASAAAPAPDVLRVRQGQRVSAANGTVWEVAADATIESGELYPRIVVTSYGEIVVPSINSAGEQVTTTALIQIQKGESFATLVDLERNRLPTDTGFGPKVDSGMVLRLTSQLLGSAFGSGPDITRDEYAILSVGSLPGDRAERSVLYLDRPWDLDDWVGKWSIEDRTIVISNAETFVETFTLDEDPTLRINARVQCSFGPIIDSGVEAFKRAGVLAATLEAAFNGSGISVLVNGLLWEETASLLLDGPSSQVYQVDFDQDDKVVIIFGDGVRGAVPPAGTVTIQYRVGGGVRGNVTPGNFQGVVTASSSSPLSNQGVSLTLSNPYTFGTGGQERESLDAIKANLRNFIRSNDRAVSAEDYESLAGNFTSSGGRVALAKAVRRTNTVPREQNVVWVHVWVKGPLGQLIAPDLQLKTRLLEYLNRRKMATDEVVVVDGKSVQVPLMLRYRYGKGVSSWEAKEAVAGAIAGVMAAQLPGVDMDLSNLYLAVRKLAVIESVVFDHPTTILEAGSDTLFGNSVTQGAKTSLTSITRVGDSSIVVDDHTLFGAGQNIMIYEANKTPTVAVVDQASAGVVSLRNGTCRAEYSLAAEVYNSTYASYGWNSERPVIVFVRYVSNLDPGMLDQSIKFCLETYFTKQLRPGKALRRTVLEQLLSGVNGIAAVSVFLGKYDSQTEEVTVTSDEQVTLAGVVVNGIALQPS